MSNIENLRYLHWRNGWVGQHRPDKVEEMIRGLYTASQVKWGDIKKGQGDIVLVNLENEEHNDIPFNEYITHFLGVDRIEKEGIYTNVYFSKKFFKESINKITNNNK